MKGIAITLGMVLLLAGCAGATLPPDKMGTTAKCLHEAKSNFEPGSKAYNSAVNDCMWSKGMDVKD